MAQFPLGISAQLKKSGEISILSKCSCNFKIAKLLQVL